MAQQQEGEFWFAYVRRIKRNDYQGRKCAECSIKHRPKWADWSWWTLFGKWLIGADPFFRLQPNARYAGVGYNSPKLDHPDNATRQAAEADFAHPEECDHIYRELDPTILEVRQKIIGA